LSSHTSQRYDQSFVKELAKPTHNGLTTKTEEEHRTDNSTYPKGGFRVPKTILWLMEVQFFKSIFVVKVPPFG
jgi:hypothetical protein